MLVATKNRVVLPDHVQRDVPLSSFTAYGVGGFADYFCVPETVSELTTAIKWANEENIPFFVLGSGSNVLISDEGYQGLIIHMVDCCKEIKMIDETTIDVGAAVNLYDLVLFAEKRSLNGIVHLSGIPGTLGGAVHMNAGAFVGEIGDAIKVISLVTSEGLIRDITSDQAEFGYRQAPGIVSDIISGCIISLQRGNREIMATQRKDYLNKRKSKQPLRFRSCGSVFKRPPGDFAGRLIQVAGLKGKKIGDAQVSDKHANFILNRGKATAGDIYKLITYVQKRVYENSGILLEPEVKLVGFGDYL